MHTSLKSCGSETVRIPDRQWDSLINHSLTAHTRKESLKKMTSPSLSSNDSKPAGPTLFGICFGDCVRTRWTCHCVFGPIGGVSPAACLLDMHCTCTSKDIRNLASFDMWLTDEKMELCNNATRETPSIQRDGRTISNNRSNNFVLFGCGFWSCSSAILMLGRPATEYHPRRNCYNSNSW